MVVPLNFQKEFQNIEFNLLMKFNLFSWVQNLIHAIWFFIFAKVSRALAFDPSLQSTKSNPTHQAKLTERSTH